jgi:hypothetical protein
MTSSLDRKLERVAREIAEAEEKASKPTEGLTPIEPAEAVRQYATDVWRAAQAGRVLTDADAEADLNGTPRPDNPTGNAPPWPELTEGGV